MDRRSLLDDEDAPEEHRENVFDDDHEVEDFDMVADGFRPTNSIDAQPERRVSNFAEHILRSSSIHNTVTREPSGASRNSIRKSRNAQNPFSHPDDLEGRFAEAQPALQFEPDVNDVRRSISSASSAMFARTHSPRFGTSAMPSHPYNMYPQDTMHRSSSTTTTSTVRQQSRLYSPLPVPAPQHPYAMYAQGVDEDMDNEDEDSDLIQQNPVTVGFSGVGNRYRRQVGPDGEEQDIIGEDGHTEQLPPYSRYPEDGPEKMPLLVPTALHSRAPVHGTDPGMPLMHTTMQPVQEPQSMTDEADLERPQSMASLALLRTRSSQISTNLSNEKSWSEKSWRERRSSRICGIPVWWFLALLGLIIFATAVIGGIAGGYLAGRKQNESQNPGGVSVVTVITSLYDASQIATPTGPPPATGTFALALSTPQDVQSACLAQPNQAVAWSCDLAPNADLAINVTLQNGSLGANLFYGSNDFNITYGAQAPDLDTTFAQFLTVQDNDDPGNGPAFYFQQTYNKVVVVPEEAFNPVTGKLRRDLAGFSPDAIPAGSKPWYCVWNETFLEGFIFVEKPMVSSTSASSNTLTSTTIPSTLTTATTTTGSFASVTATPFALTANSNIITATLTFAPGAAATYTGPASGLSSWLSQNKPQPTPNSPGPGTRKRQVDTDIDWPLLPKYPNMIKLEERRTPGSAKNHPSYCQQYRILWNGRANWEPDANGNPIRFWLSEQDPSYAAYQSAGLAGRTLEERSHSDVVDGGCHCQWLSGGA